MPNEVVTNRAPASGSVAGVSTGIRFSLKRPTAPAPPGPIDRALLQCYSGSASVHYDGAVLPPDNEFALLSYNGSNGPPVNLSIGSLEELVITTPPQPGPDLYNWQNTFYFGGLLAPALPSDPLMAEFRMMVNPTEMTPDPDNYYGAAFGLLAGKKGLVVKFSVDAGVKMLEVWSTDPHAGGLVYSSEWDWSAWTTYKLLWHPGQDVFNLYVSSGTSDTPDQKLVEGAVSAFADLPDDQIRPDGPWAFFGNISILVSGSSRWSFAALYNKTITPIHNGIITGSVDGFINSDEATSYLPSRTPDSSSKAWNLLPLSFGALGGSAYIETNQLVIISAPGRSIGYSRVEPALLHRAAIFDFTSSVVVNSQATGLQSSCFEAYIDDGVRSLRLAFLEDEDGTTYIGVLKNPALPGALSSYELHQIGIGASVRYRLALDQSTGASITLMVDSSEGGVIPQSAIQVGYSDLPVSSMPGPGFGFLHNGTVGEATATMRVDSARYFLPLFLLDPSQMTPTLLPPNWSTVAGGRLTAGPDYAVMADLDTTEPGNCCLQYAYAFGPDIGFAIEFRARIADYSDSVSGQPIRALSGFQVSVVDSTGYALSLLFADAGPPFGRIVFIQSKADPNVNLDLIRAGDASVAGTYAIVDWTSFNLYQLQKTLMGSIVLFLNGDLSTPLISLSQDSFSLPNPGLPGPKFYIGNLGSSMQTTTDIGHITLAVAAGYDIALFEQHTPEELQSRFGNSVNYIVEYEAF
jgi:hypothetical protein